MIVIGSGKMAPSGTARPEQPSKTGRTIEFMVFFGILPLGLHVSRLQPAGRLLPLLIMAALVCLFLLWTDRDFDKKSLWHNHGRTQRPGRHPLLSFGLAVVLLALLTYACAEKQLLHIIDAHPYTRLLTLLSYPLIAAYAQEVVFRGYFFHRYRRLFQNPEMLVMASGVSFGLFHLSCENWIDPFMAAIFGMVFGYRYLKTRSLVPVAIEHALFGRVLMMIGLGWLFAGGAPAL